MQSERDRLGFRGVSIERLVSDSLKRKSREKEHHSHPKEDGLAQTADTHTRDQPYGPQYPEELPVYTVNLRVAAGV
jgi:hypothetical protein